MVNNIHTSSSSLQPVYKTQVSFTNYIHVHVDSSQGRKRCFISSLCPDSTNDPSTQRKMVHHRHFVPLKRGRCCEHLPQREKVAYCAFHHQHRCGSLNIQAYTECQQQQFVLCQVSVLCKFSPILRGQVGVVVQDIMPLYGHTIKLYQRLISDIIGVHNKQCLQPSQAPTHRYSMYP